MKNILGHDNNSEISTVVKLVREGKFEIRKVEEHSIYFTINLSFYTSVPISSTRKQNIDFFIVNNEFEFLFYQINGESLRTIDTIQGYIIWTLLTETI